MLSRPLLVKGFSGTWILKPRQSSSTSQYTPRARSSRGDSRVLSLAFLDRSDCGIWLITVALLHVHLVMLKPPSASSNLSSAASCMASSGDSTDFRQSST